MFAEVCVKYSEIARVQIKLALRMNLALAILILALVPVIFGISNHDYRASAFILERFVSLTGIALITPVFLPEQDKNIAELAESKYTSSILIYLVRFMLAAVSLMILISGFTAVMILSSCEFDAAKFIAGTFATAFFLGALGFTAYAITDNIVAGYLFALVYYTFNMFSSGAQLKNIYLFTLADNDLTEKYRLLIIGALLSVTGFLYKFMKKKLR